MSSLISSVWCLPQGLDTDKDNEAKRPNWELLWCYWRWVERKKQTVLHPVYRRKRLRCDQINTAQKMLLDLNSDLVPDLLKFMSESTPIPNVLGQESTINSVILNVWWQCMERQDTIHRDLCTLALKLLSVPASSATIERFFFKFCDDPVQTQKQTRNI